MSIREKVLQRLEEKAAQIEEFKIMEESKQFTWHTKPYVAQDKKTGKWHAQRSASEMGVTFRHKQGHDSKEAAQKHAKSLDKTSHSANDIEHRSNSGKGEWKPHP